MDKLLEEYKNGISKGLFKNKKLKILVVGGGAGGTEVALSVNGRLKRILTQGTLSNNVGEIDVTLITLR